jgi:hypothetical protein
MLPGSNTHKATFCHLLYFAECFGKAELHCKATPVEFGSPHEAICAGLVDIYLPIIHSYLYFQAHFPVTATRGADVVVTRTYPSIPNNTVNVMRHKQPSWTSPLAKANRPRSFIIAHTFFPAIHHVGFTRLFSKDINNLAHLAICSYV